MKVLSLFDGMACGMLAFRELGIEIERYVAYEIDKYAIEVSCHNFPNIEQRGDVFEADFTEFEGFDFVIGGSPCTYWSIAQTKNRETEAHGIGWELFQQYVRAIREAKPKFFVYENNKSMSVAIREEISETFGFEPIMINSARVSAQNRERLYWVGVRQNDGTYRKADIEQPDDRGILLKDVLDEGIAWRDKSHCIDANYFKGGNLSSMKKQSGKRLMVAEPVAVRCRGRKDADGNGYAKYEARSDSKSNTLDTNTANGSMVAEPVNETEEGKAHTIKAQYYKNGIANFVTNGGFSATAVAEPIRVGSLPRPNGELSTSQAMRVYSDEGKGVGLKACGGGMGGKTGLYAIPICVNSKDDKGVQPSLQDRIYDPSGKMTAVTTSYHPSVAISVEGSVGNMYGKGQNGQLFALNSKTKTLSAGTGQSGSGIGSNNSPKAVLPYPDYKGEHVYEVDNGRISIKGKQYPIKLPDGLYIIRKLTVSECKRLQTVPEDYDMSVISNTQAYKCLGNGWTVKVIAHLITSALEDAE